MRRRLVLLAALALALAGCGGSEALTNGQVEAMSEEDAAGMLNCQLTKAAEDLGQQEAADRYGEALMQSAESDGDMLHVILDGDGYSCPEFVS